MSTPPTAPASVRARLRDFALGVLPTWIALGAGLWWAFARVDRWAERAFARPGLAAALVAVIDVALFGAALCLAPAVSRVLRFDRVPLPATAPVVLFDGVCGLCTWLVRFAVPRDRVGALRFAPLQGEAATRLLGPATAESPRPDSVAVVIDPGTPEQRVLLRSAAILYVLEQLGGAWRLLLVLWLVPGPLRDFVYDRVAAVRYRLFGRRDACLVPTDTERDRFLD